MEDDKNARARMGITPEMANWFMADYANELQERIAHAIKWHVKGLGVELVSGAVASHAAAMIGSLPIEKRGKAAKYAKQQIDHALVLGLENDAKLARELVNVEQPEQPGEEEPLLDPFEADEVEYARQEAMKEGLGREMFAVIEPYLEDYGPDFLLECVTETAIECLAVFDESGAREDAVMLHCDLVQHFAGLDSDKAPPVQAEPIIGDVP